MAIARECGRTIVHLGNPRKCRGFSVLPIAAFCSGRFYPQSARLCPETQGPGSSGSASLAPASSIAGSRQTCKPGCFVHPCQSPKQSAREQAVAMPDRARPSQASVRNERPRSAGRIRLPVPAGCASLEMMLTAPIGQHRHRRPPLVFLGTFRRRGSPTGAGSRSTGSRVSCHRAQKAGRLRLRPLRR